MELASLDHLPLPAGPVLVLGDAAASVCAALQSAGASAEAGQATAVSACAVGRVGRRRLAGELPPCPPVARAP